MSDSDSQDERQIMQPHKSFQTFSQRDTVNRVQGLAELSDIEILKRQNLLKEEVVVRSREEMQPEILAYKERLLAAYKLEVAGRTDYPQELTNQRTKTKDERRMQDVSRQ